MKGRHYRPTDALEYWLHEYTGNEDLEVTPKLQEEWEDFTSSVKSSLTKNLGVEKTNEIYAAEGRHSVNSYVFATLIDSPIFGTWDGAWERYMFGSEEEAEIRQLTKKLKKDLGKFASPEFVGAGLVGKEMLRISGTSKNPYLGDAVAQAKHRQERDEWEREGRRGPPPVRKLKARLLR